jgi:hypothetical protein
MNTKFDVFRRLPDGKTCWITSTMSFEDAQKRVGELAAIAPGQYLIYSEKDGGIVERFAA